MKRLNDRCTGRLSLRFFFWVMIDGLAVFSLPAQTLSVLITNTNDQPIPNATVFIRETAHGLIADSRGECQAKMNAGDYTLDISSLGYESIMKKITIPAGGLRLDIQLTERLYTIPEVTVTPGKEDPAFRIMRNVVGRAPYHLHQVKSYESDIYFKGSLIIEKIPALILSQIKEPALKQSIGKTLVYESQNEVRYNAPNNYEQRIIALTSTIPESFSFNDRVPVNVITQRIYDPRYYGGLLGPGSFALYNFKLEDASYEGEHTIYKIRILPKKKSSQLVSGWLNIVDDTWTVKQASLEMSDFGSSMKFNLNYHEVKPGAFLPVSSEMIMEMNVMGMKGGGRFFASVKYNQLETTGNTTIAQTDTTAIDMQTVTAQKPLSPQQQKAQQQIEELVAKDNLTNREAYRMAQLVEKSLETPEIKAQKRQLERRSPDSTVVVTRDSLALLRDSTFWNMTRIQPLREEELRSYIQYDSLKIVTDSLRSIDSLKNRTLAKWTQHLLMGEKIKFNPNYSLQYDGLLLSWVDYNFVDGFRLGQRVELGINLDKNTKLNSGTNNGIVIGDNTDQNHALSIAPAVYYTTARRQFDYTIDGKFTYAPLRLGKLSVSAGNTISDYAGANLPGRFVNSSESFSYGINIIKFYQKRFATVTNEIDIANGLKLTTGFNYEKRNDLENATTFNIYNREPASNRPHGQTELMPDHEAYIANIELTYTPRHHYTIYKGRKYYLRSDFPTIRLRYHKGFAMGNALNSSFEFIETSIVQGIGLGMFDRLSYAVNAGMYLSAKQTYLPDFKHFQTNESVFTENALYTSFLLDNYRYATNDKWLQAHVTYTSQYLLFKRLPFMQRYLFDEAVHLRTLWTPAINHNEAGYSIGLGDIGRIGVSVGFRGVKYENVGVTISMPLFELMKK